MNLYGRVRVLVDFILYVGMAWSIPPFACEFKKADFKVLQGITDVCIIQNFFPKIMISEKF